MDNNLILYKQIVTSSAHPIISTSFPNIYKRINVSIELIL